MRMRTLLVRGGWIALAIAMITSGCTKVGPDYVRPESKLSKSWIEAANEHSEVKEAPADYRAWWSAFQDPTLDRLVDIAYRENLSLQAAGMRVLEARAQLGIVIGEQYPQSQQLTGLTEFQRTSARSPQSVQLPFPVTAENSFFESAIAFQATWEIDFWGRFRRAVESADADLLAAIASYDNTLVTLVADVAANYITIRTLEERLKIARENVVIQQESLQLAQTKFTGGATTQRDVEQALTLLASTQASIPQLEQQLRKSEHALCTLLGMPPRNMTELLSGASGIPAPPAEIAVGIPVDLLRRRPDVRNAELQAIAQCAEIGVAKADLYPAFSLTGSFGFLSSDKGSFELADMFSWKSRTATVGPTFQWNILNYGQITNNIRLQDAKFQELLLTWQNGVLSAQKEVEDALIAFLKEQERAKFLAESAEAASRSLNLAVIQYAQGMTDFTTVLTAQQSLLEQQDTLASSVGNISSDAVSIYRALGGGWQIREGKDFVPSSLRQTMAQRTNWGELLKPVSLEQIAPKSGEALIRRPDW